MIFRDRKDAGTRLAQYLQTHANPKEWKNPLILALPRGGVPVAHAVARQLAIPWDVLVTRKIGSPSNPEFAIGALAEDGDPWLDRHSMAAVGCSPEEADDIAAREAHEVHRRVRLYRGGKPIPDISDRTVILIDDGLATGATARASLRWLRARGAKPVILALPVGAARACSELDAVFDKIYCLLRAEDLWAVGQYYEDFQQITDAEVLEELGWRKKGEAA